VLHSGQSVLLGEISSFEAIAYDKAHAELLKEIGVQSIMSVPVIARGRTLGALTFVAAESGRRYSTDDLDLAEEVGRRAALAIDNARLYEQAQRASQARQDILAIVSHDLRNPLGSILLRSYHLLKQVLPTEEPGCRARKDIEAIEHAARQMNRIITDLVDIASIESGYLKVEKKRHQVTPLVQEALDVHEPFATQKKVRLDLELPSEPLEVNCDRERVLQVFGNLIGNAIKFTPEGGTIKVHASRRGEEILFSVADTGAGIQPDELPHVFDRYWQAKKTARLGTGLGLSIAEGLVEVHGGRIWAESKLGHGATFFFTIPVVDAAAAPARPVQEPARNGTRLLNTTEGDRVSPSSAIVFLVDDDDELRESISQLLEHESYVVLCARDGREALARMRSISGPAVAVIDLMMPGMDGWKLARTMKADPALSYIPIIVVSSKAGAYVPGADRVLEKPCSAPRLFAAVKELLAAEKHHS